MQYMEFEAITNIIHIHHVFIAGQMKLCMFLMLSISDIFVPGILSRFLVTFNTHIISCFLKKSSSNLKSNKGEIEQDTQFNFRKEASVIFAWFL